jgi:hypothetical protein
LLSPKSDGRAQSFAQSAEVGVPTARVKRANTTSAAPTRLRSTEGKEGIQQDGRPDADNVRYGSVTGNAADKIYSNASLPARPTTSFECVTPHRESKPGFSKQSPERRYTHRRQSSLDTESTTLNHLSDARARLRSTGEETTGKPIEASRGIKLSPVRRKTDIHDLQDLVDNAIDEQAELDNIIASTKQSPRLNSIASQVEMTMTSPSKRQSIGTESSGSPLRRGHSARSPSRPRVSIPAPTNIAGQGGGHHPSISSNQQTSPTTSRKPRLSTESVLPRSSIDSEPSASPAYASVYSSPEIKPGLEVFHLHPLLPGGQAPSPVKQRTAAFEKMMQHDKQIMYDQAHKQNGNIYVKKHWLPDSSDDNGTTHVPGKLKREHIATTSKIGRTMQYNPPTNTRNVTPTPNSGPIPLALPQLISSRGGAVSASSQLEESFQTAPQSEAALSRLSSRVHSPRTVAKAAAAQDVANETRSPFFRWKPFMLEKKAPAHHAGPISPQECSFEGNAGRDVPEKARDSASRLELRAGNQDAITQLQDDQSTVRAVVQSNDVGSSTSRRPTQESRLPGRMTPRRLTLRNTVSTKQDLTSMNGAVNTTVARQVSGLNTNHEAAQTEQEYSSGDMTVDDGKEVALPQSDNSTEAYDETKTEPAIEATTCSQPRWKDSTPFPLIPVEASSSAPASGPGSPVRGRAASRALHRQTATKMTKDEDNGHGVRVSRSRSKAGNVRVTVEVRTPKGSPVKGNGEKGEQGNGGGLAKGMGERVVIVTTDVQEDEEE